MLITLAFNIYALYIHIHIHIYIYLSPHFFFIVIYNHIFMYGYIYDRGLHVNYFKIFNRKFVYNNNLINLLIEFGLISYDECYFFECRFKFYK